MDKKTNNKLSSNEDIDLLLLANIFKRRKKFILGITILSFIFGCFFAVSKKRVWSGQFEIVLDKGSTKTLSPLISQALQQFSTGGAGISTRSGANLNTEVGILESQSVLMPIFNYVKSEKERITGNPYPLNFEGWKKTSVKVKLKKQTSILNFSYRDTDKSIILPVLTKISQEYQGYAGKRTQKSNETASKYVQDQIKIYKEKSKKSSKKALEFAIDNDLTFSDLQEKFGARSSIKNLVPQLLSNSSSSDVEGLINQYTEGGGSTQPMVRSNSIELIRVQAATEIKSIDNQIKKINNIEDTKDLQYLGSTIPSLNELGLPKILESIETQLIEVRSKYTENDLSIKRLLEKRELYSKLIKERAIGYLKARRIAFESLMESVEKPKGVIVKGKELIREANRDERTLVELEEKFRTIQLASARSQDPWKLISEPTLSTIPVAPDRKKIAFIAMLSGLFGGFLISYTRERISGLVYEESILEELLQIPILKRIQIKETNVIENPNELKFEEIKNKFGKVTNIMLSTQLIDNELDVINRFYSDVSKSKKIEFKLITSNYADLSSDDSIFFMTSLEKIDYKEIEDLKNRLSILKINLNGIILKT